MLHGVEACLGGLGTPVSPAPLSLLRVSGDGAYTLQFPGIDAFARLAHRNVPPHLAERRASPARRTSADYPNARGQSTPFAGPRRFRFLCPHLGIRQRRNLDNVRPGGVLFRTKLGTLYASADLQNNTLATNRLVFRIAGRANPRLSWNCLGRQGRRTTWK